MSKRNALGRHSADSARTNSIAGLSKAVAANAGSFGRSAAVVAAASGMVLTLGVPAQANPAAREAAAAPMDALNIERVALQSTVVATVVAPSADAQKVEAGQRASVKTAPAPQAKPVTVAVKAEASANRSAVAEAATEAAATAPTTRDSVAAAATAAAEAQAAQNRAEAEQRAEANRKAAADRAEANRKAEAERKAAAERRAAANREAAQQRRTSASSQSGNAFAPVTRTNRTGATATAPKPVASSVNTRNLSGIAATASRYSGVPYVWGGSSPAGWDCSGFVQWVYKQHGINIARGTSAIRSSGQFVRTSNPKPGDLVFQNGGGHVGIYLGNGMMIGAQNPTVDTMIHSVSRNPLYGYYTLRG